MKKLYLLLVLIFLTVLPASTVAFVGTGTSLTSVSSVSVIGAVDTGITDWFSLVDYTLSEEISVQSDIGFNDSDGVTGFDINDNFTKILLADNHDGFVGVVDLSTAGKMSTQSHDTNKTLNTYIINEAEQLSAVRWGANESSFFLGDFEREEITRWDMSVSGDPSTATVHTTRLDTSSLVTDLRSFEFFDSGNILKICGSFPSVIKTLILDAPYDFSSYTVDNSKTFTFSAGDRGVRGFAYSLNEKELYTLGTLTRFLSRYELSVAQDDSTAVLSAEQLDPNDYFVDANTNTDIFIADELKKMYVITTGTIFTFELALQPLTLSASTVTENSSEDVTIGTISGIKSGSVLTLTDNSSDKVKIVGTTLKTSSSNIDYEATPTFGITFTEANDNYNGTPKETNLTITVTNVLSDAPPQAMVVGDWTAALGSNGTSLDLEILSLPDMDGEAVTSIDYRIDQGTWADSGITSATTFSITGLTTDVEIDTELRVSSAIGDGAASDIKTRTPTVVAFSPINLSPIAWYDASNGSSVLETTTSGRVKTWSDLSGNGNHLTATSSTNEPLTGTTTQNSLNTLEFTGSHYLSPNGGLTGDIATVDSTDLMVFVVMTKNTSTDTGAIISLKSTSGGDLFTSYFGSGGTAYTLRNDAGAVSLSGGTFTRGTAYVFGFTSDGTGSEVKMYQNGTVVKTVSGSVSDVVDRFIVGARSSNGTGHKVEIGEIVITTLKSESDITDLNDHLKAKWSIP